MFVLLHVLSAVDKPSSFRMCFSYFLSLSLLFVFSGFGKLLFHVLFNSFSCLHCSFVHSSRYLVYALQFCFVVFFVGINSIERSCYQTGIYYSAILSTFLLSFSPLNHLFYGLIFLVHEIIFICVRFFFLLAQWLLLHRSRSLRLYRNMYLRY